MASCMKTTFGSFIKTGFLNEKKRERRRRNVITVLRSVKSRTEQYKTLELQPGISEKEVKNAFRRLALKYHPDVCKGRNCGLQFHQINEAYDVMRNLRESNEEESHPFNYSGSDYLDGCDEPMRGMHDSSWDLWEEWMGWEGAGIQDFSSHINPYI